MIFIWNVAELINNYIIEKYVQTQKKEKNKKNFYCSIYIPNSFLKET